MSHKGKLSHKGNYTKISAVEAKRIMDTEKNVSIIDVRDEEEREEGYIDNSIIIPLDSIYSKAENIIKDKNTLILVYCRSGKRSMRASEILLELGYKNVYDFGGIIDWPFDIIL